MNQVALKSTGVGQTTNKKGETMTEIKKSETPVDVPRWIEHDITGYDIEAIQYGGCASGAYMPAVTYWQARETMNQFSDEIFEEIENAIGPIAEASPDLSSWDAFACWCVSSAVELWASQFEVVDDEEELEEDSEVA
jgi:hypothetical protein